MLSGNIAASLHRRNDVKFLSLFCSVAMLFFFYVIPCESFQTTLWVEFCISEQKNTLTGTMCVVFIPPAHNSFVTRFQLPGLEFHSLLRGQRRSQHEPVCPCLPGVRRENTRNSLCVQPFPGLTCFIQGCKCTCPADLHAFLMELKA